jgi:uncharacterized protein YkwD
MDMAVKSYNAICWYENLKQFPKNNNKAYTECANSADFQKDYINEKLEGDDQKKEYFGKWIEEKAMDDLDTKYGAACNKYLKDAEATPEQNESDTLNDAGNEYPFKAFAYCLLSTLRGSHGDEAIKAVETERTKAKKHWKTTIMERDNEWRARHGDEAFKRVTELDTAAQKWADKMAKECKMEHSKREDPDRQWRGKGTGESLASGGTKDIPEINAYIASNGWYQEIKDYPYKSGGFKGKDDALFKKIGHFTQTVWEDTKYVGYGYAYNKDCPVNKFYIAARYSPAGNVEGKYPEKVPAPKE